MPKVAYGTDIRQTPGFRGKFPPWESARVRIAFRTDRGLDPGPGMGR